MTAIMKDHVLAAKVLWDNVPSVELIIRNFPKFLVDRFPWFADFFMGLDWPNELFYENIVPILLERWNLWNHISDTQKEFFYEDSKLNYKKIRPFLNLYLRFECRQMAKYMATFAQIVKALLRTDSEINSTLPIEKATGKRIGFFNRAAILPIAFFLRYANFNIYKLSNEALVDLLNSLSQISPGELEDKSWDDFYHSFLWIPMR